MSDTRTDTLPAAGVPDPAATLAAWRAHGDDRHDPVRFRFIEALARRVSEHEGEARRVLDDKLAQALKAYGERWAGIDPGSGGRRGPGAPQCPVPAEAGPGPLGRLVREITASADATAPAELKALRVFGSTWSRLSADQRLRQSRAAVPGHAGPLHSHALVLRALTEMRALSPGYLSRFMSHVDALQWLEQAQGGTAAVPRDVLGDHKDTPRKHARSRQR